jgi:hypothetical protein
MIKESLIPVEINTGNAGVYKKKGIFVNKYPTIIDLPIELVNKMSKTTYVTAICEKCGIENKIKMSQYTPNKNNKFYACKKCQFLKNKITCIERYGVDSYFKTDESKEYNRKWMSSDEFKEKSKIKIIEIYGVNHYSKTENFKKDIYEKKDMIIEKIRQTFLERYDVLNPSQLESTKLKKLLRKSEIDKLRKETCIERYGVDNVAKDKNIYEKVSNTKELNGVTIPKELLSDWNIYKRKVRNITNSNKKNLYENWNGNDYYDNELIKGYLSHTHTHRYYPTIDHKISVYFGFMNDISPEEIGSLDNLCITKRFINSMKGKLIENNFNI